jgi:hypothetical protein
MALRRSHVIACAGALCLVGALAPAAATADTASSPGPRGGDLYPLVVWNTPLVAALAPSGASTPNAAVGVFHTNLIGTSIFTQTSPTTVRLQGSYTHLIPGAPYFSVIYANKNCDPAQAFPIGPFFANAHGNAQVDLTVTGPAPVSGTMSVSVRHGDDATDQDHDGKLGPTDVVAVPGQPSIGLVECDNAPLVRIGATVNPPTGDRNLDGQ